MKENFPVNSAMTSASTEATNGMLNGQLFWMRTTGVAAIIAGTIFAGIQPIHPPDIFESVLTTKWTIINSLKLMMCFLFMIAIQGFYFRHSKKVRRWGVFGILIFSLNWLLQSGYVFTELFILPKLVTISPDFVKAFLTLVNNTKELFDIGIMRTLYMIAGLLYLLGGTILGIAIYKVGDRYRWIGLVITVTAMLTPLASFLPHSFQRLAAVPMGLAFVGLGLLLLSNQSYQQKEGNKGGID